MNTQFPPFVLDDDDEQLWVGYVNPSTGNCNSKTACSGVIKLIDGTPLDASLSTYFKVSFMSIMEASAII